MGVILEFISLLKSPFSELSDPLSPIINLFDFNWKQNLMS